MTARNLRKMYMTFAGNIQQMAWMIDFYGDNGKFAEALKSNNWDLKKLKADVLRLQGERSVEQSGLPTEEGGEDNSESVNHILAMRRLKILNAKYRTRYRDDDLKVILKYVKKSSNQLKPEDYLDDLSGKTSDGKVKPKDGITLAKLFPQNKKFMRAWGKRRHKEFLKNSKKRYEKCDIYWKKEAHERVASTPDTFVEQLNQSITSFNNITDPAIKISTGELSLVRLVAAKATGQDQRFLKESARGVSRHEYIEAELHAELEWADVSSVHVGDKLTFKITTELKAFKKEHNYTFEVTPDVGEE